MVAIFKQINFLCTTDFDCVVKLKSLTVYTFLCDTVLYTV